MKVRETNFWQKFEIAAVAVTGLLKFLLMDWLELRFLYIAIAVLFWIFYGIISYRRNPERIKHLGLNTSNFFKTAKWLFPVVVALSIAFLFYGNWKGTNVLNMSIIPILLIYPIWGIVQQFIIVALIAGNLKSILGPYFSKTLIVIITSVVFGVVHFPHNDLVIATTFMALVYTSLYLKGYNILVMGILHGWIGAVFFYTVMGRDAWAEVFGKLF